MLSAVTSGNFKRLFYVDRLIVLVTKQLEPIGDNVESTYAWNFENTYIGSRRKQYFNSKALHFITTCISLTFFLKRKCHKMSFYIASSLSQLDILRPYSV